MVDIFDRIKRQKLKFFNAYPYPARVIVYIIGEDGALRKAIPDPRNTTTVLMDDAAG